MTKGHEGGATLGLGEALPGRGAHRFSHAAMATVFEVHCVHADARYAAQAAQAAFDLVDRLEQDLSRFIPNSDVSRVNDLGAGRDARVSPSTMECLRIAWHVYDLTGGAFDVSIGSGLEGLELDPDELTVHAREGGARLDLGGIGKGYAVDRMAEVVEEWEIPHALVHGGFSSVLALEAPPEREGWPLTLSAPGSGDNRVLARVSARRQALSASGVRKGDHILDPRTGLAVRGRAAAWVAIPRGDGEWPAAVADALSTAFMIQPADEIAELCRRSPGLEAWLVAGREDGDEEAPALVHLGAPGTGEGGASS
jgi:FAD:protein FMN transferase